MKVLYGVQGTGNGHITRARAMATALRDNGHEVDYLFSGRAAGEYFDMEPFGRYELRQGVTFHQRDGRISPLQTLMHARPLRLLRDIYRLDLSGYDLLLNDFEPVSAWAARRQGIPSLALSHQAALAYDIPKVGDNLLNRMITRKFAPTQGRLGIHWYHFGQPIVPPLVEPPAKGIRITSQGFVLVYLPFEPLAAVCRMLRRLSPVSFVLYHPAVTHAQEVANLRLFPLSRQAFHRDLAGCDGVIANGGFELPSEAMQLGKKLLLLPLAGQYEQRSNVATLEMMGLARSLPGLDDKPVRRWLEQEPVGRVVYPQVAPALAARLPSLLDEDLSALIEELWEQVVFPETVLEQLDELQHGHWPKGTPPHRVYHSH